MFLRNTSPHDLDYVTSVGRLVAGAWNVEVLGRPDTTVDRVGDDPPVLGVGVAVRGAVVQPDLLDLLLAQDGAPPAVLRPGLAVSVREARPDSGAGRRTQPQLVRAGRKRNRRVSPDTVLDATASMGVMRNDRAFGHLVCHVLGILVVARYRCGLGLRRAAREALLGLRSPALVEVDAGVVAVPGRLLAAGGIELQNVALVLRDRDAEVDHGLVVERLDPGAAGQDLLRAGPAGAAVGVEACEVNGHVAGDPAIVVTLELEPDRVTLDRIQAFERRGREPVLAHDRLGRDRSVRHCGRVHRNRSLDSRW